MKWQVDALYVSPALRCSRSLEPLAERFGLDIGILAGLAEAIDAWRGPAHLEIEVPAAVSVRDAEATGCLLI